MTLTFVADANCPRCGKLIRLAVIKPHPTRIDAALRSLECRECGHETNTLLSLRPQAGYSY
jgi:Zn ribbon nucleic-acid-binding protein